MHKRNVCHSFKCLCARHTLVLVLWRMLTDALAERREHFDGESGREKQNGQGYPSELDTSENLCTTQGTHSLLCGDRNAKEIHKTGDLCVLIDS